MIALNIAEFFWYKRFGFIHMLSKFHSYLLVQLGYHVLYLYEIGYVAKTRGDEQFIDLLQFIYKIFPAIIAVCIN